MSPCYTFTHTPVWTSCVDFDACHGDAPSVIARMRPGMFWTFTVPVTDYTLVCTLLLELLGVSLNIHMLLHKLNDLAAAIVRVTLRTDASASALSYFTVGVI